MARPKRIDEARARELYEAGCNDPQIARQLGCGVSTVCKWRARTGLEAHWRCRPLGSVIDDIRTLLSQGLSTRAIADQVGVRIDYVRAVRWRDANPERVKQHNRDGWQRYRDAIRSAEITG